MVADLLTDPTGPVTLSQFVSTGKAARSASSSTTAS